MLSLYILVIFSIFLENIYKGWSSCLKCLPLKAACLQIHANFHENFENYLKVKYCEVNKESNLHIANSTYNPSKLSKRGQNIH
jgi:hypothetical protein